MPDYARPPAPAGWFRLLVAMTVAITTLPAWAQNADGNQTHGDWTVRCTARENMPPCDMVQVVSNKENQQPVMVFSVGHAGRQEQYGLHIGVPLGVLVSGGALLRIDGKEEIRDLKFTRCLPSGCQIEARLDPDRLQPLRRGDRGFLIILDGQGKPLMFPVSFKGFTAAMDAMAAKNRVWAQSAKPK